MKTSKRVLIVGAGHAGGSLAAQLRQSGFAGDITLIGAENTYPYHRPPLSKSLAKEPVKWLNDPGFYDEQKIVVRLGTKVTAVDQTNHHVQLSNGEQLAYDYLVLATGAEPRRLDIPGATLAGVLTLRDHADAEELHSLVDAGRPLAIIGGGFIGLEVAAAARAKGVEVTILERDERILGRAGSPALSSMLTEYHRSKGTRILTGCDVLGFQCDRGDVRGVSLANGQNIRCGTVLVGAGATPRDELAVALGLNIDNGVIVDECGKTSDPAIYAIGDLTNRPVDPKYSSIGRMRMESIPSAVEQARNVAASITSTPSGKTEVPWFWSDQFDLKLKIAGIVVGDYQTSVLGDPHSGSYALFHHDGGRLVAAETVNSAKYFMQAKRILATQTEQGPDGLQSVLGVLPELVRK